MPAYVIVETDIHDPEQYEQYKAASPAAVAGGGGRFVVRGGELAVLEGLGQANEESQVVLPRLLPLAEPGLRRREH